MKTVIILLSLTLTACDRDQPPAPSADQSARLDEAEAMLNDMAVPAATNEEGPEAKASDPSANAG